MSPGYQTTKIRGRFSGPQRDLPRPWCYIPGMKKILIASALMTLFGLAGCGKTGVSVNCRTTGAPSVECEVKQTQGTSEIEACWDFEATCANGEVVKAPRSCEKLKDGGSAKVEITADKLENLAKCGGEGKPTAKVSNLTINGKAVH